MSQPVLESRTRVEHDRPGRPGRRPAPAATRPPRRRFDARGALTGWGFIGPAFLIIIGLSVFPAAWAFVLSRRDWNGFTEATPVGWDNYRRMSEDPALWDAVEHTVLFTALFVPASILLGMVLAIALNQQIRLIGFYRTAIFVPFVASAAAIGILANFVFNPEFGLANNLLRVLHLPQQGFLEDGGQAMGVIALMALWQQVGFVVVIYLAALQGMPRDPGAAAMVDGAGRWSVFRHVTFPELLPVTVFVTIWQTITAFQLFDLVYTTTRGGPLNATETVVYYLYDQAFKELDFGYGSAIAYGLFAFTMIATLVMVLYSRRNKFEAF